MEAYEISDFVASMKKIENFLSELAARDTELRYAGIGSSRLWDTYKEAQDSFEGFDRKLYELTRLSKFVDLELHERIKELSTSSDLAKGITQVAVSIRIAERRRDTEIALRKVASTFLDFAVALSEKFVRASTRSNRGLFFSDFDVSLSQILVGLNRLIPLSEEVADTYYAKKITDDHELFKPANINSNDINIYIENTLNIISESGEIGPDTKDKLIEYLDDIRAELVAETPKWKKIVGGLVIVSTILGGLAVAPEAIENVQKAVTEILGTSIEKKYPHSVPPEDSGLPKLITS